MLNIAVITKYKEYYNFFVREVKKSDNINFVHISSARQIFGKTFDGCVMVQGHEGVSQSVIDLVSNNILQRYEEGD